MARWLKENVSWAQILFFLSSHVSFWSMQTVSSAILSLCHNWQVSASFDGADGCLSPFWASPLIPPTIPLSCSHFHFVFLSVILLFLILLFFIFPLLMLMGIVWGTILGWISHGIYILISLLVWGLPFFFPSIIIFCNKCRFHFLKFPLSPGDLIYKRCFLILYPDIVFAKIYTQKKVVQQEK